MSQSEANPSRGKNPCRENNRESLKIRPTSGRNRRGKPMISDELYERFPTSPAQPGLCHGCEPCLFCATYCRAAPHRNANDRYCLAPRSQARIGKTKFKLRHYRKAHLLPPRTGRSGRSVATIPVHVDQAKNTKDAAVSIEVGAVKVYGAVD